MVGWYIERDDWYRTGAFVASQTNEVRHMFLFGRNQDDILNGSRVLVIGFGRQGQALARWLPSVGARGIVTDRRSEADVDEDLSAYGNVRFVWGDHPLSLLDEVDLICVSGGVPLTIPIIEEALKRKIPVTNDAQLFVERCAAPVIGITGSAGKTTTTTLVGEMLKNAGFTTWIGGNIGKVLLDVMIGIQPDHKVVMELSSFQLELMHTSPSIASVLNITPNHLDRHGNRWKIICRAKAHIVAKSINVMTIAILGRDDPGSFALDTLIQGHKLWFSKNEMVSDGAFMVGQRLAITGFIES